MATKTIDLDNLDPNIEKDRAVLFGLGLHLEVWTEGSNFWLPVTGVGQLQSFCGVRKFRRKPITRTITIPQCLTEVPESGTTVFFVCLTTSDGYSDIEWAGSALEIAELKNGGIFATEEDAKAFVTAMKGTSK